MKNYFHSFIFFTLLFALPLAGICQSGKRINVLEIGILANSKNDQTEAIQQVIDQAKEGDTAIGRAHV